MNGEWDAYMYDYAQLENGDFGNANSNNWWCLNYTHIQEMYGDELNVSPRMGYSGGQTYLPNHAHHGITNPLLVFMDTDQEKKINLAPDWPYGPIDEGGCIVSKQIATELEKHTGDKIQIALSQKWLYDSVIGQYNARASEHGW